MNKGELNDLKITISQLVEYYKEMKELKTAGLDLIKLAPVATLANLTKRLLASKYTVCIANDIISYAENPKIDLEYFYNVLCEKYALKYDEDKDDGIHGVEFCIKDPSYQAMREEDLKVKERFHRGSQDEEVLKEVCDKIPTYYVNGKKVAKEVYDKALKEFDSLKEDITSKFDKALDEAIKRYFK